MKTPALVLPVLALLFAGCIKTDRERALDNGAEALSKQEAVEQFTGNTLVGVIGQYRLQYVVYYDPDGRISGEISGPVNDTARGTWRVTDDGQVCNDWTKATWGEGPACNTHYREGDEYKVFFDGGGVASVAKIEKGNSRKLEMRTDFEIAQVDGTVKQISVELLRKMILGNTLSGKLPSFGGAQYHAFYGNDGKVSAKIPGAGEEDRGTYRITDEGKMCVKWTRWQDQKESCGYWYRDSQEIKIFDDSGNLAVSAKIRVGDPEKLGL